MRILITLMMAVLMASGCTGGVRESDNPMVWVTPDLGTYHTRRCPAAPAGTPMKRQQTAEAEGLTLCIECSTEVLPGAEAQEPPQAPSPPPSETLPAHAQTPEETMVYVTDSGKKYHRAHCVHLRTRQQLRLEQALRAGYTPCDTCNPPRPPRPARVTPVAPAPALPPAGPRIAVPR